MNPWLLHDHAGDVIAYFEIGTEEDDDGTKTENWALSADMSGRHYDEDEKVISILKALRLSLGGEIVCAP